MRRPTLAACLILALAGTALAQSSTIPGLSDPLPPTPSYTDPNQPPLPSTQPDGGSPGAGAAPKNVTATGRVMPPTTGRKPPEQSKSSAEAEMAKAQKVTEERNKAWDAKMRKTMGSICVGC